MNAPAKLKPNRFVVLVGQRFRDAHDEVVKQEPPHDINVALERLGHSQAPRKKYGPPPSHRARAN